MVNMEYCKFENTYLALQDCLNELDEVGNLEDLLECEELTEVEKSYIKGIIATCEQIAEDYGN